MPDDPNGANCRSITYTHSDDDAILAPKKHCTSFRFRFVPNNLREPMRMITNDNHCTFASLTMKKDFFKIVQMHDGRTYATN
jgi:hypothetical protein